MRRRMLAAGALLLALGTVANGCFEVRAYPGPALCTSVKDCDDGTPCTLDYCFDGACHHDQVTGTDAEEAADDENRCTTDTCVDGVEANLPIVTDPAAGCGLDGTFVCDAQGQCTGCTEPSNCGTTNSCRTWTCDDGICHMHPSAVGKPCNEAIGVCDGMGHCVLCDDDRQNAGETDIDCGGPCVAQDPTFTCEVDERCDVDVDCDAGLICKDGVCTPSP